MVVQCGRGSDGVQGLSVRALATVSPCLLGIQHFGNMKAEPAARLIEVWHASCCECVHILAVKLTPYVQECQRRTSGQVRTRRYKPGRLQLQ